jgi:hypothetical protein
MHQAPASVTTCGATPAAVCAGTIQRLLSLATPADVAGVWVAGLRVEAAAYPEPR